MTAAPSLACLSYAAETDGVGDPPSVLPEMLSVASALAERYLRTAAGLVEGAGETVHLAFDPTLISAEGRAPRHVSIAASAPNLARHLSEATGRAVGQIDVIVTMGSAFVAWDGDDARLREVVASDLGHAIGLLYPARGQGTLERLMPWLLQIAAEIVVYGPSEPAETVERAERAVAKAFNGVAQAHYHPSWNALGQLLTDHPAWPFLAEETAREAVATAATSFSPATAGVLARLSHEALARALSNLGVRVEPVNATPPEEA